MKPQVTYDGQLRLNGAPALIQAGTLHYFRLPHPALWSPVLQRMRGGGLNAVVVPFPWAYHSPAAGLYDFTGPRDIPRLLDEIEAAGLWLIADVGPWIEADLNMGGLPAWFVNTPGVRPDCASVVPPGPSFAFLRYVREWWERLLPPIVERLNLLMVAVNPGPCADGQGLPRYRHALVELAREFGAPELIAAPAQHLSTDDDPHTSVPIHRWRRDDWPNWQSEAAGLHALDIAPPFTWNSESRESLLRRLGAEHPRIVISRSLGQGATGYALAPTHTGVNGGYWGMADACAAHGVGAPLSEGTGLTAVYFHARRMALAAETLGQALTAAQPTSTVYAADSRVLCAVRAGDAATVAFLDTADLAATETRLSTPLGDAMLTTTPFTLPEEAARVLPLHWRIPGGKLLTTTLEPVLRMTVAGRHLLILTNENGGDLLLSEDFRPRHARGPVRTQRTDAGLAVHFETGRWVSLLLDGPEGMLQLLALEPRLAARVWPLDDTWRTTPAYPAAWHPAPEDPARGLVIGPEWVQPQADGSYRYLAGEKGAGYRWGPWRGSDPHTWLAPLTWRDAPSVTLPPLVWQARQATPEIAPDYDDSLWTPVALNDAPAPGPLGDGFTWYRGRFDGAANHITLCCDQASDVFLNGALIAALNTPPQAIPGAPKTLPLPQHLLHARNTLAILVENLGQQRDWEATARARGLTACALDSGVPIRWRVRWGLSGERAVQGFAGYADWALVPDDGAAHITWHRAIFGLALPDDVDMPLFLFLDQTPGRAYLFLNGQLIGRYADHRAPQHRFWLPEGLLRRKGENELLVAQWTRGAQPGIGAARLEHGAIMQWHTQA
ncbi:MAG TPA: beta-galactosidase [Anaerolineae bacterium]|nr:beta-galactosidase [Anaerolineae bacterium]HQI84112.1 beta-galactosidase [Anaerolineae bacterium]